MVENLCRDEISDFLIFFSDFFLLLCNLLPSATKIENEVYVLFRSFELYIDV